jgi:hypothetical protein
VPTTSPTLTAPSSLTHGADGQVVVAFPNLAPSGTFHGSLVDPTGAAMGSVDVVLAGEPFPEVVVAAAPVAGKWTLVYSGGSAGDTLSATATPGVFTLHNG